jgi:tetratricopeptide (TPR) repeat protein
MPERFGDIEKIGIAGFNSPISIQTVNVGPTARQLSDTAILTDIPQNIPFRGATKFVGRTQELETLHQELQRQDRVVISAIAGMGGVGKTELAIQYAVAFAESYSGGICWLNAKEDLLPQVLEFAQLGLNMAIPNEVGGKALDTATQVQWCLRQWRAQGQILMVLDDVVEQCEFQTLVQQLPKRFRVLITTRLRRLDAGFFELPLDVLSPTAATDLLAELVGAPRIQAESATAQSLCQSLGYLPLGVELVGRYLAEQPFLKLADLQVSLDNQALDQRSQQYVMTAQQGVRAAFELSWQALTPPAQNVGRLLSQFAEDAIPWDLVVEAADKLGWAANDLDTAQQRLYKLHLIQTTEAGQFKLHPLIHEFLRLKHQTSEQAEPIRQAFVDVLVDVAKAVPETSTRQEITRLSPAFPHLENMAERSLHQVQDSDLEDLFEGFCRFYWNQGLYEVAQPWCEYGLQQIQNRLGDDHPTVATSLNNLAGLYRAQGRYGEAEPLYLQALEMHQRLLGDDHPEVATSLNNLAGLYRAQGRYGEAEPLYLQALEMRQRLLGDDHPTVATSLNNLAGLYRAQGRYGEAEPLYLQALEMHQRLLGDDHPEVATSLNNLAGLYETQGRYGEAEPLYLQALEMRQRLLGDDHPYVATSLNNLAGLYETQGRYGEAEPLYLQALEMHQRLLGDDHPEVATSLHNLAGLYRAQGRYGEAEPLYLQDLEMRQRLLGDDHPYVATSLNNLAGLYETQGRYGEAEPLYLQALEMRQRLLGNDHPEVATSLNNLAGLYRAQGRYGEAEPLYLQDLEMAKRLLGNDHPEVATSLNNLAGLYRAQGRYGEAEPLYLQDLEMRQRLLGDQNPSWLVALRLLFALVLIKLLSRWNVTERSWAKSRYQWSKWRSPVSPPRLSPL